MALLADALTEIQEQVLEADDVVFNAYCCVRQLYTIYKELLPNI